MQADLSTLRSLKARLEEATGPDRELDAEIMFDLFAKPAGRRGDGGPSGYLWPGDNPSWSFGMRFPGKDRDWFKSVRAKNDGETLLIERDGALVLMNQLRVPKLTASLDAALSLVNETLPGWWWKVASCHVSDDACVCPDFNDPAHGARLQAQFFPIEHDGPLDGGFDIDQRPPGRPAIAILRALVEALIFVAEVARPTPSPSDGGEDV